ncbi:hypothetical protein GCM10009549_41040 [Streptomyces thermoalcalitolerans]|uniref:Uncharacterized protein n=1 Tax=Streptomyces thermoalcalitolerans TaxID=65605 RepID=A0ABP3ZGP2_9ACTN
MYDHHDAILHAVREGVLIVGEDGRLLPANSEARRLPDLPPDAEGRRTDALPPAARATASPCWWYAPMCSAPSRSPTGTCPATAAVPRVRAEAVARREAWGPAEAGFATELILGEPVTNAVRHSSAPPSTSACCEPQTDLRGLRRQQHLAPSASRGHH